ncbi:MAG: hypothetical protein ACETWG_08010, partial [Candidatus Neomarinimicrobiota bacterium]
MFIYLKSRRLIFKFNNLDSVLRNWPYFPLLALVLFPGCLSGQAAAFKPSSQVYDSASAKESANFQFQEVQRPTITNPCL